MSHHQIGGDQTPARSRTTQTPTSRMTAT